MTLFNLGQVVGTPGALEALHSADQTPEDFLNRHSTGDWGELDEEDLEANRMALTDGSRILSAYTLKSGAKMWIITEADRSSTCLLLPDEY